MPSAVIYARFSSDQQLERSIDDQVALCRAFAAREQLTVTEIFEDRATSGASLIGRAGMLALLERAASRSFDVVIAESLSRIGRDEEDRAGIRKRLTFHGIRMATPADGYVSPIVDGIRAVIDSVYLADLKAATLRGMAGVVRASRSAGGRAYGYRPVAGRAGELEIVEPEAAIVRRIVADYLAGKTPRAIARALNREGVPAPRGGRWSASTITGNAKRGNGILANELYAGVIVWNKVSMFKDPQNGRRVSRANSPDKWQRAQVPALRILPPGEFERAADRRARQRQASHQIRKPPKRMLSGLLRCGSCGGGMSAYGPPAGKRIACSTHLQSGSCPAPVTFTLARIETLFINALRAELTCPQLLAIYAREYHDERQRLSGRKERRRQEIDKRLAEISRALARATDALLEGIGDRAAIDARCKELAGEREVLGAELATMPERNEVISLHPQALARYAAQLAELERAIGASIAAADAGAAAAIRDLVESVTVKRNAKGEAEIEIAGRLSALLDGSVGSGDRNRSHPSKPLLFRIRAAA